MGRRVVFSICRPCVTASSKTGPGCGLSLRHPLARVGRYVIYARQGPRLFPLLRKRHPRMRLLCFLQLQRRWRFTLLPPTCSRRKTPAAIPLTPQGMQPSVSFCTTRCKELGPTLSVPKRPGAVQEGGILPGFSLGVLALIGDNTDARFGSVQSSCSPRSS